MILLIFITSTLSLNLPYSISRWPMIQEVRSSNFWWLNCSHVFQSSLSYLSTKFFTFPSQYSSLSILNSYSSISRWILLSSFPFTEITLTPSPAGGGRSLSYLCYETIYSLWLGFAFLLLRHTIPSSFATTVGVSFDIFRQITKMFQFICFYTLYMVSHLISSICGHAPLTSRFSFLYVHILFKSRHPHASVLSLRFTYYTSPTLSVNDYTIYPLRRDI